MRTTLKSIASSVLLLTGVASCAVLDRGIEQPVPEMTGGRESRVFETDFSKSGDNNSYLGDTANGAEDGDKAVMVNKETEKKGASDLSLEDEIEQLVQSLPDDAPTEPPPEAQPSEPVHSAGLEDVTPKENERKYPPFDGKVVTAEPGDAPAVRLPAVPPASGVALGSAEDGQLPAESDAELGISEVAHGSVEHTEPETDKKTFSEALSESVKPHQNRAMPKKVPNTMQFAEAPKAIEQGHAKRSYGSPDELLTDQDLPVASIGKSELGATLSDQERAALHERYFPNARWRREHEKRTANDPPAHKTPRGF